MNFVPAAIKFLTARKHSYQMVFARRGSIGEECMNDLRKFCRAEKTPGEHAVNDYTQGLIEGRRSVYRRIEAHLTKNVDELAMLFGAQKLEAEEDD